MNDLKKKRPCFWLMFKFRLASFSCRTSDLNDKIYLFKWVSHRWECSLKMHDTDDRGHQLVRSSSTTDWLDSNALLFLPGSKWTALSSFTAALWQSDGRRPQPELLNGIDGRCLKKTAARQTPRGLGPFLYRGTGWLRVPLGHCQS